MYPKTKKRMLGRWDISLPAPDTAIYDLGDCQMGQPVRGIYIQNRKKFVK